MKNFKIIALVITMAAAGASIAVGTEAMAQTKSSSAENIEYSEGVILSIHKDVGQVTIKHGELKNLHMPAMTMMFGLRDKTALGNLRIGDKVKFLAIEQAGALLITEIKKQ